MLFNRFIGHTFATAFTGILAVGPLHRSKHRMNGSLQELLKYSKMTPQLFRDLHNAGRDDLINEVSRFMSTSFVGRKKWDNISHRPKSCVLWWTIGLNAVTNTSTNTGHEGPASIPS